MNLDIKRVEGYRNWCNKLWNAVRFALMNLSSDFRPSPQQPRPAELPLPCRWILSRLGRAIESTVSGLESYNFSAATQVSM